MSGAAPANPAPEPVQPAAVSPYSSTSYTSTPYSSTPYSSTPYAAEVTSEPAVETPVAPSASYALPAVTPTAPKGYDNVLSQPPAIFIEDEDDEKEKRKLAKKLEKEEKRKARLEAEAMEGGGGYVVETDSVLGAVSSGCGGKKINTPAFKALNIALIVKAFVLSVGGLAAFIYLVFFDPGSGYEYSLVSLYVLVMLLVTPTLKMFLDKIKCPHIKKAGLAAIITIFSTIMIMAGVLFYSFVFMW
jgi:hypothetical protein